MEMDGGARRPTGGEVDDYLRDRETRDAFAGVARITVGLEERFAGAYGLASRAWHVPNTLETRFDTASITKLFTAVATLQQVDTGAFGLDTSAIDYLDLRGTAISRAVTVRHLLTHTSGIGDDADEEAGEAYEDLWRTRPNYSVVETTDFLPQFVHRAPNFAPGEGCRYNNCAYVLLGLMIERATGRAYRDVVRERVFAPADMADSEFLRMDRVNERQAEGSDPIRDDGGATVGWKRNIFSYPPIGSPDGGAYVTAADLDRFMRAATTGQLLSAELTAAFLTPQAVWGLHDGWTQHWGFGPSFGIDDSGQVIFLQKEGSNPGVGGLVRHYPGRDLTMVVLSNLEQGTWETAEGIHAMIVAGAFD
jgi:CubicO group peptidase (beta-lactamase class C family)